SVATVWAILLGCGLTGCTSQYLAIPASVVNSTVVNTQARRCVRCPTDAFPADGHNRSVNASAAASRSAAHRTPGLRPMRSIGPDTDTAATTLPDESLTGADTLATPGSRSATLCAQPRLRTSSSVRSP